MAAWVGGGLATDGCAPIHDAISELAKVGAPTRPWMTAGMIAFGVGVPLFATGLRQAVDGPAWIAAVAAGAGSLAVAAVPLQPDRDVPAHAVAAAGAYVALALVPLLAARSLPGRWRPVSLATGAAAAACLAATAAGPAHGLFQRLGLTLVDAWLVALALRLRSLSR
ncbi:MAG: hypothetical protein JWN67_4417 [Actinomycetia bacterium]|nr:hypothetical protein [Actinomycetes bacterium]